MAKPKSSTTVKANSSLLDFFKKTPTKPAKSEGEDSMDVDSDDDAKGGNTTCAASSDAPDASDDEEAVSLEEEVPLPKKAKAVVASATRPVPATAGNRLIQKMKDAPHMSDLPPINDISEMFKDIVNRNPTLVDFAKRLNGRPLRVATMCSGTEAPLLALGLVSRALREDHKVDLNVEHVFSCEIEPFKQAYIERNFHPPILFRDVCELGNEEATTAYGAKVKVPGDVDMLIAGTSCVDYSTLNNEKQDIEADGESGRTFRGMLSWVKNMRPMVVILENVCGAPWDKVVKKFQDIGYSAAHQRFDTKKYYVPHTRTRGYMVAFNIKGSSLPDEWKKRVAAQQRPASSSLDAFLLESDDPRIHHARQALVHEGLTHERKAGYEWGRCESRHIKARHDEQLGNRRPLTGWEEGGTSKLPDYAWNDWGSTQVDRVWDLMDITFLRAAAIGKDPQYKTEVWNLSQNVDRQIGSSVAGIAPCFTPTMIPFLANRGGPIVGCEALALQGLPVDELNLTRETQDQLADLAGNAMSTTVVGTAMVAALTLAAKKFAKGPSEDEDEMDVDSPSKRDDAADSAIHGVEHLDERTVDLSTAVEHSLTKLRQQAEASVRLCGCEGRDDIMEREMLRCTDCGSTACIKCAGRPEHNYVPIVFDTPRLRPVEYRTLLKEQLAMSVMLGEITSELVDGAIESAGDSSLADKQWKKAVLAATKSPLQFKTDKRQDTWLIVYASAHAVLELHLKSPRTEWLLYAVPDAKEPANSTLRSRLMQPIARRVCGETLFDGIWEIAVPTDTSFSLTIEGSDELVPGWETKLGLECQDFQNKRVWSTLTLSYPDEVASKLDRSVAGEYRLFDKCGTANSALHKRVEDDPSQPPLFLFLDPSRCGDPSEDQFVLSSTIRRTEYGESRPVFASLDASWRPTSRSGPRSVKCYIPCLWVPLPSVDFKPTAGIVATYHTPLKSIEVSATNDACESANAVLVCSVPLPSESIDPVWPADKWTTIDSIHERATFQSISWLLERVRNFHTLETWTDVSLDELGPNCDRCSPPPPAIRWTQSKKGIVAIEDALQAGDYEHALKQRPTPFVAQLKLDTATSTGMVRLGINISSLLHRAQSSLPHEGRHEEPKLSWRLTTGYVPPIRLSPPKFTLRSNRSDKKHEQPPHFKLDLRVEQLRSLGWMLRQEAKTAKPFMEEEVAEAILTPLGWRVEAKVQRPVRVSGGVLADEVGYGKTAITLGLIDAGFEEMPKASKKPTISGRIRTNATVIAMPAHLTKQWRSEIDKFLGKKYKVLKLETMTDLNKTTIQDILDAHIILVASTLQKSDAYLNRLGAFSGIGKFPTKDGRYFDARLAQAHAGVKAQVSKLRDDGASAVFTVIKDAEDHPTSDLVVASRRLKGKQYRDRMHEDTVLNAPKAAISKPAAIPEVVITSRPPKLEKTALKSAAKPETKGKRKAIIISDDEEGSASDFEAPSADEDDDEVDDEVDPSESEDSPPPKAKTKVSKTSAKQSKGGTAKKRKNSETASDEEEESDVEPAPTAKKQKTAKKEPKPVKETPKVYLSDPWGLKSKSVRDDWTEMKCPPLEMFHFHRHVIDEYTYLEGKVYSLITTLDSYHRWILSGTPPTQDFTSVKTIAAFMGVHLGIRDDFWEGQSKESLQRAKKRQKEQTSVESFHSFREIHSLDWHAHRDEVAQSFLDHFVRQNIAEIDEIPFDDSIRTITLPAAERAIYLELEHHLRALDMTVRKTKKTESDREKRMQESLGNSGSAEEALLKRCSHFELEADKKNALKACELIVQERTRQLAECVEELKEQVAKALKDEKKIGDIDPQSHFRQWCRMTRSPAGVGDLDAKTALHEILDDLGYEDITKKKSSLDLDNESKKMKEARWAHREHSHILKKLEKELVGRHRSLRYFTIVRDLQHGKDESRKISCPGCDKKDLPMSDIAILSSCGHTGCHSCVIARAQEEECVCRQSDGCTAAARVLNVVKADTLGMDDEERDANVKHFGMKLEKVVALIKKCIAKDDSVLLFVQFPDLMAKVAEALSEKKVKFLEIKGTAKSKSNALAKFQADDADEKVLLLNVGDESASGANLTKANHVVFLSPLLTPSQQFYSATDIQAIGRVRRYGQQKKAYIYRFLTLNSIDVEIFEARDGRKVPS